MELVQTPFAPRPKELDPVEGVGWGNRASLRLVSGPTYHSIELVTDITDPTDIERVEVSLNGSAKINVTGETLVKLQAHRKNYAQPGRYIISFGDATLRTKIGVRLAWSRRSWRFRTHPATVLFITRHFGTLVFMVILRKHSSTKPTHMATRSLSIMGYFAILNSSLMSR